MIESVSRFVEVPGAEATAQWLKTVQDELGEWHDEIELTRRVTAILSEDGTIKPTMLLPPSSNRSEIARGRILTMYPS